MNPTIHVIRYFTYVFAALCALVFIGEGTVQNIRSSQNLLAICYGFGAVMSYLSIMHLAERPYSEAKEAFEAGFKQGRSSVLNQNNENQKAEAQGEKESCTN